MNLSFKKKIIIIDDHPMMRKGLFNTLETVPGYEVVAQFEKAEDAIQEIHRIQPDLIIVDISLPGMNGIELVKNVTFQNPDQKMLIVSRHEESFYAERALKAGAKGYVMKFEPSEVLLKAVKKVFAGGIYVSEEIGEKLLKSAMSGKKPSLDSPVDILSDREIEVFELIGRGKTSNEIADQLHLAKKTIETYRSRIKEKMDFKNSTELVIHALKWVENEHRD
jgi:DNA-binding NarL/FixJ family response regulator